MRVLIWGSFPLVAWHLLPRSRAVLGDAGLLGGAMVDGLSRRQWIAVVGTAAAGIGLPREFLGDWTSSYAARVTVAKWPDYGSGLISTLSQMMDQLGGLSGIVKGKSVAVKINLTGDPSSRVGHAPLGSAQWVHPNLVGALVYLMGKAGARRIRLLESTFGSDEPLEEFMLRANWEPHHLTSAASNVEFENTNYLGTGKKYSRLKVPGVGLMFQGFDVNHSYLDCDVFVSVAKLKEHWTAGVTLSLKNCFGITPCTIYGDGAGEDEPSPRPRGGRGPLHNGYRLPSRSAPSCNLANVPKDDGFRVPRIVVDLVSARPIHLSIIDGIETMFGGEGPWIRGVGTVHPGVLIAGTNPVSTDAVATAVMGFDPCADRGKCPFERCDNTLLLAENKGLGSCKLSRVEIVGTPLSEARLDFRSLRGKPRASTLARIHGLS